MSIAARITAGSSDNQQRRLPLLWETTAFCCVYWGGWCSSLLKKRVANSPFWKRCKVKSWGVVYEYCRIAVFLSDYSWSFTRTISSTAKHHKRDRSRDEMTLVIRHLRIEIWTSLHEIPIKSEGVFFGITKSQFLTPLFISSASLYISSVAMSK